MNKKKIKIIGFIPAKKNSKDLKNKNFRKINNLSLFELAILNAKKSKFIEKLIDEEYLEYYNFQIFRQIVLHCILSLNNNYINVFMI